MKTFRQFLAEITVGQREQHPSGEYEWKGAQWIKQNKKGLKPAAKKDIGADLTKQAEAREKSQQKAQKQQYKHTVNVKYSKPGSEDMYGERVEVKSPFGGGEEGQKNTAEEARKHFEGKGYKVHTTEWVGAKEHKEEPKQQHQEPIGPQQPKKEKDQQHDQPIGPPGPGKQQHDEPIGPKMPGQQHQAPIGPEKPKEPGQQHNAPIGPKRQKKAEEPKQEPEASVSGGRQDYVTHVWDRRRDRKAGGSLAAKQKSEVKTAVGKTADFLITGQTTAFDKDFNKPSTGSSWLQKLADKKKEAEEKREAQRKPVASTANNSQSTTNTTNEGFITVEPTLASQWLNDLSRAVKGNSDTN